MTQTRKQYGPPLRVWKETSEILNFICSITGRSLISTIHRMAEDELTELEASGAITREQRRKALKK